MFRILRNKKGVTLVELLAVVVILGIIAAIAVPTIGGLISRQQEKADVATLTNVVAAAKNYATAEDDDLFTIADMASYIDLGSNTLGETASADEAATIFIQITGNTVTFYDADPVSDGGVALTSIFVNDTEVLLTAGVYVPE